MPDIIQEIKDLMCAIYELWGGDCDDLEWPTEEGIEEANTLVSKYDEQGAPPFANETERESNLALLTSLETKLDDPGNPLDQVATTALRGLIADIRNDYASTNNSGSAGSGSGSGGT